VAEVAAAGPVWGERRRGQYVRERVVETLAPRGRDNEVPDCVPPPRSWSTYKKNTLVMAAPWKDIGANTRRRWEHAGVTDPKTRSRKGVRVEEDPPKPDETVKDCT